MNPPNPDTVIKPRLWHVVAAVTAGLAISFLSWNSDRLANRLLSDGVILEGKVTDIRHVSESRLCSIIYSFTAPDGSTRIGTASLGKPYCPQLKKMLKNEKAAPVDVLWNDNEEFMLKIDAHDRINNTFGGMTYLIRFLLTAMVFFGLVMVISSYAVRKQ